MEQNTTRAALIAELDMPAITDGSDKQIAWAEQIRDDLVEWVIATMHQLTQSATNLAAKGRQAKAEKLAESRAILIDTARRAVSARWLIDFRGMLRSNPGSTIADLGTADERRAAYTALNYWLPRREHFAATAQVN